MPRSFKVIIALAVLYSIAAITECILEARAGEPLPPGFGPPPRSRPPGNDHY